MEEFKPKIDPKRFEKDISEHQSKEGNNGLLVGKIIAAIAAQQAPDFYGSFLKACRKHIQFGNAC